MAIAEATPMKKARTPKMKVCQCPVPSKTSIKDMERELGLDKVRPIALSPSAQKDLEEKGDPFKDMYEEELRDFYRKTRGKG